MVSASSIYAQHKADIAKQKRAKLVALELAVKQSAIDSFLVVTKDLLDTNPVSHALAQHLDWLFAAIDGEQDTYKRYWRRRDERRQLTLHIVNVIRESIHLAYAHIAARLSSLGIHGQAAYATSPREGTNHGFFSPGSYHFLLLNDLNLNRLKRVSGDAICKPRSKF